MTFNSWQYLAFLPVTVLAYFLLPHKLRWVLLLAASYFFYMMWNPWLAFLILGTTVVAYGAALAIKKVPKHKKLFLVLTLVVCLGVLFGFKYLSFALNSVVDLINLFPIHVQAPVIDIILPVGISFYTFQTLSYVIDVYRGEFEPEKHFGYFALYVSYFPQLVAGPIETPKILLPQLREEHHFNTEDLVAGLRHLLFGFLLKVAIADIAGIYVNRVFASLQNAGTGEILAAVVLFAIQIYCDFNGYSEIAIGSARVMGVKLSQNFDDPFMATSMSDLFRRWHMSLQRWFLYYVYIPLGGNRKGKFRHVLNTLIVFALCGLWHGANWTYVLWGLYAGVLIVLEILVVFPLLGQAKKKGIPVDNGVFAWIRRFLIWAMFIPSSILFRSANIQQAGLAFTRLFAGFQPDGNAILGFSVTSLCYVLLATLTMELSYHYVYRGPRKSDLPSKASLTQPTLVAKEAVLALSIVAIIAATWVYLLSHGDVSTFAYFQF